jgi:predicted phage gp36 major capsid-like protein
MPGRRALALVAVLLAGCGGPIADDELERGIKTLGSTAAEGSLVARGVQNDRTKTTFVRVELRDLSEDAEHEAEKLSDAEGRASNEAIKAQAVELASKIDSTLGELQVDPRNRALAKDVGDRLDHLASEADQLAGKL